jgi:peptidoglycan/LPS O-acetylase OafA/YrhL
MIKPLTSLRFFFAFMVFLSHIKMINPTNPFLLFLYDSFFSEGYLGVSFFFILSGFILALNYNSKIVNEITSYKEFWVARFARIYPLHFLTFLLAFPFVFNGNTVFNYALFQKTFANMFLIQSFFTDWNIHYSFNAPSWSISDEMFFYLLFPFIITLFYRFKKLQYLSIILLLIIPIGIFYMPTNLVHRFFYVNPLFRIVDFLIGILLFSLYNKKIFSKQILKNPTLFEIFAILVFILFYYFHTYLPKGYRFSCYYWVPMIMIILVFAFQAGKISKILSHKYFVLLGEISFGFYLLHFVVINYFAYKIHLHIPVVLQVITVFLVTLILSYITYNYFELPANKYIKSIFKRK